jgi:hypothetical protein
MPYLICIYSMSEENNSEAELLALRAATLNRGIFNM